MDDLDLTPLARTIQQFRTALAEHGQEPGRTLLRDGLIQRFEFTYSLAERMVRRHLELASGDAEEIDRMSFPTLIRTASERGLLLHGWDHWEAYRRARNKTSHTYNEDVALEVVAMLPAFLIEAEHLLAQLEEQRA